MTAGPSFMMCDADPDRTGASPRPASYPGTGGTGRRTVAVRDRFVQPWLSADETSLAVMSTIGITRS
jgi:hypothetical protein